MSKLVTTLGMVAVIAGLGTGCTSTHVSKYSAPLQVELKTTVTPEVTIGGKISGAAAVRQILIFTLGPNKFADGVGYGGQQAGLLGDKYGAAKAAAAYNACADSGCDVIVAPRYQISETNYIVYKEIHATVTGYAGTLKGLK